MSCVAHSDLGSAGLYNCKPKGGDAQCVPGCPKRRCHDSTDSALGHCGWRPTQLRQMMQIQDNVSRLGHQAWKQEDWPRFPYNEVILDTWRQPWVGAELAALVEAVFIPRRATAAAKRFGVSAHRSLRQRDELDLPLLMFDPVNTTAPFTPFHPPHESSSSSSSCTGTRPATTHCRQQNETKGLSVQPEAE